MVPDLVISQTWIFSRAFSLNPTILRKPPAYPSQFLNSKLPFRGLKIPTQTRPGVRCLSTFPAPRPPLRRSPGFHLCPTFSLGCLFSRIDPIRALPWQTSRPIPLPRQEWRQRPAPTPGDPSIFPARRERHLGAEERAPSLRRRKGRPASPW